MLRHHIFRFVALSMAAMALAGCHKDPEVATVGDVTAQIDNSVIEEQSKTFLSNTEEFIYWEKNDMIKLVNSAGSSDAKLKDEFHGMLNASFRLASPLANEGAAYAFYPNTLNPSKDGSTWTVTLPSSQPYRELLASSNPDFATGADSSFGRGVLPMVSYKADGLAGTQFTFHNVCGIMRFQLFANSSDMPNDFTINEILFEDKEKQISGPFTISETVMTLPNNKPFLTETAASGDNKKVTITGINRTVGGTHGKLLTFYLPLPSTKDLNNPSDYPFVDEYNLRMVVKGTYGGSTKWFVKVVKVPIHRLNITKVRALEITASDLQEPDDYTIGSTLNYSLVGCGTRERPYQIYTAEDLVYMRDCINGGLPISGQTVNGIPLSKVVDNTTYFKVVRSDITLITQAAWDAMTDDQRAASTSRPWTSGINDFKGIMYHASSHDTSGIINNSGVPLFVSVSNQGRVEGLNVKGGFTVSGTDPFSPFCTTNRGTLYNCHNACAVTSSSAPLAGLCVTNYGHIEGGANKASLSASSAPVAGVCYNNESGGTVSGNFSISSAALHGTNITGVCYNNKSGGTVSECQVSTTSGGGGASTGNWGVIVFYNQTGGVVNNCAASGSVVLTTTGSIGGIVHTNSGTVSNSNLNVTLRGASGCVGGIVATMSAGEVYNCFTSDEGYIYGSYGNAAADYAGGIVGKLSGGSVLNCYNVATTQGADKTGGIVGSVDAGAVVENCWTNDLHQFVGDHLTERDNYGTSGAFCFSGAESDRNWGCASINIPGYTIVVPSSLNTVFSTIVTTLSLNGQDGNTLAAALNAWVTAVNTEIGETKYSAWSHLSAYPTFTGAVTKSRKSAPVPRKAVRR